MSDNGALKSGDFPNCPICSGHAKWIQYERHEKNNAPLDPEDLSVGTGLIKQQYEEEIFHGPIPQIEVAGPMGKTPFSPGIPQMLLLVDPTKMPVLVGPQKFKALAVTQDICEKCGCVWVKHWELREVMGQADIRGPQMPGHMNPGR